MVTLEVGHASDAQQREGAGDLISERPRQDSNL